MPGRVTAGTQADIDDMARLQAMPARFSRVDEAANSARRLAYAGVISFHAASYRGHDARRHWCWPRRARHYAGVRATDKQQSADINAWHRHDNVEAGAHFSARLLEPPSKFLGLHRVSRAQAIAEVNMQTRVF